MTLSDDEIAASGLRGGPVKLDSPSSGSLGLTQAQAAVSGETEEQGNEKDEKESRTWIQGQKLNL